MYQSGGGVNITSCSRHRLCANDKNKSFRPKHCNNTTSVSNTDPAVSLPLLELSVMSRNTMSGAKNSLGQCVRLILGECLCRRKCLGDSHLLSSRLINV